MKLRKGSAEVRKTHGLLIQQVGPETLLYCDRTQRAVCLNPVATQVWQHLDGAATIAQIAAEATLALASPVTEEVVLFTLAELRREGLLEAETVLETVPETVSAPVPVPSRRDLMRQAGAGAILMLPVVAAVLAPRAAQAYTGCFDCTAAPAKPGGLDSAAPIASPHTRTVPGQNGQAQPSTTGAFVP